MAATTYEAIQGTSPNRRRLVARIVFWNLLGFGLIVAVPLLL